MTKSYRSTLNDNGDHSEYSFTGLSVSTGKKGEQRKVKQKKKCKQDCSEIKQNINSGYNFGAAFANSYQTLSFPPQSTPYNMTQPSYVSSLPGPFGNTAFGFQASPPPPTWAS